MTDGSGVSGSADAADGEPPDGDGGTYTLLARMPAAATVEVGALGALDLDAGWYAYTGSAFGPGGFARVDRHRELAAGERDARHWHVDYLLGHAGTSVDGVVRSPGVDVECAVASAVGDRFERVPAFGASDCDCEGHLAYAPDRDALVRAVERAHDDAGGRPTYQETD